MSPDEQFVADFLMRKGLTSKPFSSADRRSSKTPDFRVFQGERLVFLTEVKTIDRDQWIDQQLAKVPAGTIAGGSRPDPTYNRVATKIHDAVKQFDAVNPDLHLPNVLAFVNHDDDCGVPDLLAVTTGHFFSDDGTKHPIYTSYSEGRIRDEKYRVHLYLWLDAFRTREFLMFNLADPQKLSVMCHLFGTTPEDIPSVMDL